MGAVCEAHSGEARVSGFNHCPDAVSQDDYLGKTTLALCVRIGIAWPVCLSGRRLYCQVCQVYCQPGNISVGREDACKNKIKVW